MLTACAGAPPRPKGHLNGLNCPASYMLQFNLETDFDADGKLLSSAKGIRVPIHCDLPRGWYIDTDTKEELYGYFLKWKQRYLELKKNCN